MVIVRGGRTGADLRWKRSVRVGGQTIADELRSYSNSDTEQRSGNESVEEGLDELGVVGSEIIFGIKRAENDTKKHAEEETHGENDVELDAASKGGVHGEGTRAAEVANAQVDELGEGKGQGESKRHSDESEAVRESKGKK